MVHVKTCRTGAHISVSNFLRVGKPAAVQASTIYQAKPGILSQAAMFVRDNYDDMQHHLRYLGFTSLIVDYRYGTGLCLRASGNGYIVGTPFHVDHHDDRNWTAYYQDAASLEASKQEPQSIGWCEECGKRPWDCICI